MKYYAYVPTGKGEEPLGTANRHLFKRNTDRGALAHAVRYFGHHNFHLFRYANLHDQKTWSRVA